MTHLFPAVSRLRPDIDGNPIGNLGFSHFSPFALNVPFSMGTAESGDKLLTIGSVPMINKLVYRLMADRLTVFL